MLRFRSNWIVMLVDPRELVEVISVSAAMRPNWRSSGVATEEAIVSGLAPGRFPVTWLVGKSTSGNGETGRIRNATAPARAIATVKSVVATGLRMKVSEKLMRRALQPAPGTRQWMVLPPVLRGARRRERSPGLCTGSEVDSGA